MNASDAAAPLDRSAFLERLGGDTALAGAMAELFLSEAPRLLAALDAALAAGNAAEAARAAHALRGSVANFSALPSVAAADAVERRAAAGDVTGARHAMSTLRIALDSLQPVLLEFTS